MTSMLGSPASALRWISSARVLIQKVLMAVVLFFCVVGGAALLLDRKSAQRPGWLATILILLVCLFVGYCSAVNMVVPLD